MNKICTSVEQSKKLIELGIDVNTADMCLSIDIPDLPTLLAYPITDCDNLENKIPAWSLAALIDVIPKEVKIKGQRYAPCLFPITDGHWLYRLWYNSNEIIESPISVWCDNPIDACYEMILKLNELKML